MKLLTTLILLILPAALFAAGPNCDTILTVDDVKQQCNVKKLKYKKSSWETGEPLLYCVRELRQSFGNSVILNVSHYEDPKKANNTALVGSERKGVELEKINIGDGGVAYQTSHEILGDDYMVKYRKNNTFIELKYHHGKREKPFCGLDDLKALATKIESRLK